MSGKCLEGAWKASRSCLEDVLKVSGRNQGIKKVSEICLYHLKYVSKSSGHISDISSVILML